MPELNPAQEAALRSIVESLGPALSNAISESVGRLALVDDPVLEELSLSTLMKDADPLLQTNWTFPTLGSGSDDVLMVLSGVDALELAALIAGSESPEQELTDAALPTLSPVMQGIAQGIGIALGTATDRPIQAFDPTCTISPISVGAAFVTAGSAVSVQVSYHIQDGPDGTLTIYLTPETAVALADPSGQIEIDATDDLPAAGLTGETDISGVMAGFFGGQDGGPGFAGDAGPAGMAGFGGPMGGPIAGGPLMSTGNPFQAFEPAGIVPDGVSRSMDLIMDIPLDVSVELGRVQMLIKDVLELATGSIVELERVAGEPVDLLVNGQLIAKGEVVVIEDNFGIRITEIVSPADRIHGVSKRAA